MRPQLKEIIEHKREEVCRLRLSDIPEKTRDAARPVRNFRAALIKGHRINLIAEVKFASPSAGVIRKANDPIHIARTYEKAGAAAISLLTDKRYFKGDIKHLPRLKRHLSLPILRKDFILEEIQVEESRLLGADAVLLIARILSEGKLTKLLRACEKHGLWALTEVHDMPDLQKAIASGARIIGINNRNLDTFEVDLTTTSKLAPYVPPGCIRVSESGIQTTKDVEALKKAGIHAVLVGTALMKSEQIDRKVEKLTRVGDS
jgi:indole-3-glycerol phosphate synthase